MGFLTVPMSGVDQVPFGPTRVAVTISTGTAGLPTFRMAHSGCGSFSRDCRHHQYGEHGRQRIFARGEQLRVLRAALGVPFSIADASFGNVRPPAGGGVARSASAE